MSLSDGDGLLARHPLVHYAGAILLVYLRHANEGTEVVGRKGVLRAQQRATTGE